MSSSSRSSAAVITGAMSRIMAPSSAKHSGQGMRRSDYRDDIILPERGWGGGGGLGVVGGEPCSILLPGLCCQRKAVDAGKAKTTRSTAANRLAF